MTENEAREVMNTLRENAEDNEVDCFGVQSLQSFFEEGANAIEKLLDELCEYHAIGTVEECRNAVNLIRPRKPYKGSFGVLLCSLCGEKVGQMVTKTIKEGCMNFCANCGSLIDWSE